MGQVTWDTPPTEEELKGTEFEAIPTDWDTPPTEAEMGSVDTPEYVAETPQAPEVDEFASDISSEGGIDIGNIGGMDTAGTATIPPLEEGTVSSEEATNQTLTQPEMQEQQLQQFADDEETDISKTIAEIQQATTTMGDQLGWTDDSGKATAKFNKEATRVLKEKGYKIESRNGEKVIIGQNGKEYPMEAGFWEGLKASKGEMAGAIGAGAGTGAIAGSLAGPIGAGVGGIVGGAAGAIGGDYLDVSRNAEKYGIEVSGEERWDRALEVGTADALGGAIAGGLGHIASKGLSKIFTKGVPKDFTSVKNLTGSEKKAIKHLQEQSGLTDDQMDARIKAYGDTQKEPISELKAVEAGAKGSEREQVGYAIEAMNQEPKLKAKALEESTSRSSTVGNALQRMSDETEEPIYASLYKRRTLDDEGRRKATNWKGLLEDLETVGLEDGDPIFEMVRKNADSMGTKDTDIFQGTVKAVKPDDKGAKWIQPWTGTTRGSLSSQRGATGIEMMDKVLRTVFPSADRQTVKVVKKAIAETSSPKELEETLIREGIDGAKARQVAKVNDALDAVAEKESVQQAKVDAREALIAEKADLAESKRLFNEAEKAGVEETKRRERVIKAKEALGTKEAKAKSDFITRMGREGKKGKKAGDKKRVAKKAQERKDKLDILKAEADEPSMEAGIKKTVEAKESESPAVIRKEHAKQNTPIGADADAFRETGEARIKSQKKAKANLDKQKAQGAEEAKIDKVLKSDTTTEKDRETLDLVVAKPTSSEADVVKANKKLEELNKSKNKSALEGAVEASKLGKERAKYKADGKQGNESFAEYMVRTRVDKKKVQAYLDAHPDKKSKANSILNKYVKAKDEPVPAALGTKEEQLVRKGRNNSADRKNRTAFLEEYGYDILEKATNWKDMIKATTGRSRGLKEYFRTSEYKDGLAK